MERTGSISIVVLVVSIMCFNPTLISAQDAARENAARCTALMALNIRDTNVTSAVIIPAAGDLPEHCRVLGYVRPAIHFEVLLPTEAWNGRMYMTGCGGFCGRIINNRSILGENYAASAMDSGHWGDAAWDARWADHNRVAEADWAHRAVHETARVTKELIEAFYGRPPDRSYFRGCSTGGRMALMEAIMYPDDFDGIICGAPAIDYTALCATYGSWLIQVNTNENGKNIIRASDMKLIQDAVMSECDEVDGLKDGLIADPRYCEFDPGILLKDTGGSGGGLTAEQVRTLKLWYDGPRNSKGKRLYPGGITLGSESHWINWLFGASDDVGDEVYYWLSRDFLRFMAFEDDPGESFDVLDFDFDRDPPRLAFMGSLYNSDNPDLNDFRERGGKLLIYHGWGDGGIPPWKTIEYYEAVENRIGGREAAWNFVRLFLIPGMAHCGEAGYEFDPLSSLVDWVENGKAPDTFRVTVSDADGTIKWMRDLYPYPMRTAYTGKGDPADPSSYECREP